MNLIHRAAVAIIVISSLQVALTGGAHPEAGPDGELSNVRLTGIVIQPDRRLAIFAVTGTETRILSVGEALNGWKLDSISPGEVSLSGAGGGTRTLQPQGDTTLVRQAPLPAAPVQPAPAAPPGQPQAAAPSGGAPGPPQTAVSPVPARVGAPEPVRRRPQPPVTAPVQSAPMRPQ